MYTILYLISLCWIFCLIPTTPNFSYVPVATKKTPSSVCFHLSCYNQNRETSICENRDGLSSCPVSSHSIYRCIDCALLRAMPTSQMSNRWSISITNPEYMYEWPVAPCNKVKGRLGQIDNPFNTPPLRPS